MLIQPSDSFPNTILECRIPASRPDGRIKGTCKGQQAAVKPGLTDGISFRQIIKHTVPNGRPVFGIGGKQMTANRLKKRKCRREITIRYRPQQSRQAIGQPSAKHPQSRKRLNPIAMHRSASLYHAGQAVSRSEGGWRLGNWWAGVVAGRIAPIWYSTRRPANPIEIGRHDFAIAHEPVRPVSADQEGWSG